MNRIKPVSRRMLSVEVVRKEWRPGSFLLVTVGGEDLKDFRPIGVDQAFRLLFRRPGQGRLWLPSRSDATWMAQYMMTGKAARPYVRFYTVRHFRPDHNELDIEFVLHEGDGPASAWARGARPGEPVGILDEGPMGVVAATVPWLARPTPPRTARLLRRMAAFDERVPDELTEWMTLVARSCHNSLAPPPLPVPSIRFGLGVVGLLTRSAGPGSGDFVLFQRPGERGRRPGGSFVGAAVGVSAMAAGGRRGPSGGGP